MNHYYYYAHILYCAPQACKYNNCMCLFHYELKVLSLLRFLSYTYLTINAVLMPEMKLIDTYRSIHHMQCTANTLFNTWLAKITRTVDNAAVDKN